MHHAAQSHPVFLAHLLVAQVPIAQPLGKLERNPYATNWKAFERSHDAVDDAVGEIQRSAHLNQGRVWKNIFVKQKVPGIQMSLIKLKTISILVKYSGSR